MLGEHLNLSRSNIASYENGKAEPRAIKLAEIAGFFNISLYQLIVTDLRKLSPEQILPANANIHEDIFSILEERKEALEIFEKKSGNLKKIVEGFSAFHQLKMNSIKDSPDALKSIGSDFESLLNVMDNLIESNEELVTYLKKIIFE